MLKRGGSLLRMLIIFAVVTMVVNYTVVAQQSSSSKTYDLVSELRQLWDISLLPQYRTGTLSGQVSTYDTTGFNDDGFNGTYSYLRKTADSNLVIFDMSGPGVITRIWTPTPTNDTLDFYIDDTSKVLFSIAYLDLFNGNSYPFVAPLSGNELGGYFTYLPIPFQKHCKIVARAKKLQFHQIQFRRFEKDAAVTSFDHQLNEDEKKALAQVSSIWNNKSFSVRSLYADKGEIKSTRFNGTIKPGEVKQIFNLQQGATIVGIELENAAAFEGLSKNVDLRAYWDNEARPAINMPVADFFGYAFGKRAMQSMLIGSKDNMNYCNLPMPFDRSARIELINRRLDSSRSEVVNISGTIYYTTRKRNSAAEGKLYTWWNTKTYGIGEPHTLLQVQGKGHVVGTILQTQGLTPGITSFFEGDDSTVIDDELRFHGTGSEDYFNGGWYAMLDRWDAGMSLPIHGSLEYSLPYSRTGGYRFFLSDKMNFERSLFQSIEHGPEHNNAPAIYTSASFYYAASGPTTVLQPTNKLAQVYMPDTLVIFPVLSKFGIDESLTVIPGWHYETGSKSFLFKVGEGTRLRISLEDVEPGEYQLFGDYAEHNVGVDFSIWQRQTQVSPWVPSYAVERRRVPLKYLSDIKIDHNLNSVTLNFKSTPVRNVFLFNRFILVKK